MSANAFDQRSLSALEFDRVRARLLQLASCPQGHGWIEALCPTGDPEQVALAQQRTAEASALFEAGQLQAFDGLVAVDDLLAALHIEDTVLNGHEIARMGQQVETGERAREALRGLPEASALRWLDSCIPPLGDVARRLACTVDSEGEVLDSASSELAALREAARSVTARLSRSVERFFRDHPALGDRIVTLRNERQVVAIPTDMAPSRLGLIQGRSSSGATFFVEPFDLVPLNNERLDLRDQEQAAIRRVLRETTRFLAEQVEALQTLNDLIGILDGLRAGVLLGVELGAGPVRRRDDGGLRLEGARHPLLLLSLPRQRVVPLDLELGAAERVLVITGPNSGGKTVALKCLGLLVAMHQAGLPVPVERAELPVFRSLWAEIGDPQDLAQSLGTFAGRLQEVKRSMELLELPALVLLDELGAGTEPGEGAALAIAILEHFRGQGALALATSHHELLRRWALTTENVVPGAMAIDEATLEPLYRLEAGRTGASRAMDMARRVGLPEGVLSQADELLAGRETASDRLSAAVERRLREADSEREEAERARRIAEQAAQDARERMGRMEQDLGRLRAREKELRGRLRRQWAQRLEQVEGRLREEARRLVEERLGGDSRLARRLERQLARIRAEEAARPLDDEQEPETQEPAAGVEPVAPGDSVRVVSLGVDGVLSRLTGARAEVDVGGKRLQVPAGDLVRVVAVPQRAEVETSLRSRQGMASELHLIGLRVEEALARTDRFLDDAVLAGLPSVRIVHGHGSGRLKSAVRRHLRRHPHVHAMEPSEEDGATHAKLEP